MDSFEAIYGPGNGGDSVLRRQARLQQAWFRVHELGITDYGISPVSGRPLQSYLAPGRERANFLSDEAYQYAMERLKDKQQQPELTIQEDRLKFNMLSSQPMCFNLFADLRAAVNRRDPMAIEVSTAMFPSAPMRSIDQIVVEDLPSHASGYIHDKTGWDASIRFNDGQGVITIETKYTDKIDTARPKRDNNEIFAVAEGLGVFNEAGLAYYRALQGFDQLGRNLLLTLAYANRNDTPFAVNYVLAPAFDEQAANLVMQMKTRLNSEYVDRIEFRTIDGLIDDALPHTDGDLRIVLEKFRTRYLDLGPARAVLAGEFAA